jgi:putative copper resistance protein D
MTMVLDLQTAQHGATTVLNLAVAVVAGGSMSSLWLSKAASEWASVRRVPVRKWLVAGGVLALLASVALLCFEAETMAEVPLLQAGPAIHLMLSATHYGLAWSVGAGALVTVIVLGLVAQRHLRLLALGALAALAVYWYSRSMVSHAASEGDVSLPLFADWVHLALISLWVGEVIIAGMVILTGARQMGEADRRDRAAYVAALSSSATFALTGIFVTGLYGAWRNLGAIEALIGNQYGNTLVAKLVFVGLAAILGGFNRFVVMPSWLERESAGQPAGEALPSRFRLVLLVEAVMLLVVLMLAAILASTSPPTAQMYFAHSTFT